MRLKAVVGAAALAGLYLAMCRCAQAQTAAASPGFSVQLGPETTVLSLAERQALGFSFGPPDGYLGVERSRRRYTFFVSAKSDATCSTPKTQGTYRLGGTLTSFRDTYGCTAAMTPGGAPNGYSFDRDYAGGGPVTQFIDKRKRGILLAYHGEWHPGGDCNSVPWFYSSLGMAVSWDGGASFSSLGEIIQPYPTRTQGLGTQTNCMNAHVGSGTLVVADQNGNPLPLAARANPARAYYYVLYTDNDPNLTGPCGGTNYCVAIARASMKSVIAAASAGDTAAFPSLFKKYYQGGFTEPGSGADPDNAVNSGHYTPLLPHPTGQPTVLYDRRIHEFLMAYESGGILYLEASPNLLSWSGQPLAGGTIDDSPNQIGYPALVGGGTAPDLGGAAPYLFYLSSVAPFPHWDASGSNYVWRRVDITRQ